MPRKNGNGGGKGPTALQVQLDILEQLVEMKTRLDAPLTGIHGQLAHHSELLAQHGALLAEVRGQMDRLVDLDGRTRALEVDMTEGKRRVAGRRG